MSATHSPNTYTYATPEPDKDHPPYHPPKAKLLPPDRNAAARPPVALLLPSQPKTQRPAYQNNTKESFTSTNTTKSDHNDSNSMQAACTLHKPSLPRQNKSAPSTNYQDRTLREQV
jgi:hypothetical protein